MQSLIKTALIAALFFIPLWLVCARPVPVKPELLPLPFKQQGAPKPLFELSDLNKERLIPIQLAVPSHPPVKRALPAESLDIQKTKKFSFNVGALEVEDRDAVRLKGAKVGVDYHVDGKQSIGIESSQQIYDRQDAEAWGKSAKDESTAGIKYKLKF